jgi:hypothetical protein
MFKGNYKFKNKQGTPVLYNNGDIVIHQGKFYKSNVTTNKSPLQSPTSWTYVNATEQYRGTNPPANPKENQLWISDSAVVYTYFYDGNGYQWVSI